MIGAIFIGIQISFHAAFLALAFGYLALGGGVRSRLLPDIGLIEGGAARGGAAVHLHGLHSPSRRADGGLFSAFRMVLAPVRGSLYIVVILTSTVIAMATAFVGAAVTVLGSWRARS